MEIVIHCYYFCSSCKCVCDVLSLSCCEKSAEEYNKGDPLILWESLKWWDINENGKHYQIKMQIFKTCVETSRISNDTRYENLFGKCCQWPMSHVQIFSICVTLMALLCTGHTHNKLYIATFIQRISHLLRIQFCDQKHFFFCVCVQCSVFIVQALALAITFTWIQHW